MVLPLTGGGVHTQMYLKSLALRKKGDEFAPPVIIGASKFRKHVLRGTCLDDDTAPGEREHIVDIDAMIMCVDRILSQALLNKKDVQVEFLQYVD